MLACSECAFKGSRSGDLVTKAVDVLVLFSGCACKGSRSGDLVTQAVDGVEVQAFFQWQLTLDVFCDLIIRTTQTWRGGQ